MIHDYICLSTSKLYKVFHYNKLLKYHLFRCRLKQDPSMDNKYVLSLDIHFGTAIEALEFYMTYAHLVGFGVRRNMKRNGGRSQDIECAIQGRVIDSPGADRQRQKTSKKELQHHGLYR